MNFDLNHSRNSITKILFIGLIFLLFSSHISFAQTDIKIYEQPSVLDYVAVNNSVVDIDENGFVEVNNWDALKIAGFGKKDSTVRITIQDQEFNTTVDENGNWFVLFSITNFNGSPINVNSSVINENGEKEEITLFSLIIEDPAEEEGEFGIDEQSNKENNYDYLIYILIPLVGILSGITGWFLHDSKLFTKKTKK